MTTNPTNPNPSTDPANQEPPEGTGSGEVGEMDFAWGDADDPASQHSEEDGLGSAPSEFEGQAK